MGRLRAGLVCVVAGALGASWSVRAHAAGSEADDDDDPGIARRRAAAPAAPAVEPDDLDPMPSAESPAPAPAPAHVPAAPAPPTAPSAPAPTAHPAPRPPAREADDDPLLDREAPPAPLHVRLSYRYLTIPEVKDVAQHLGDDAFSGLSFDLYPVSGALRLGMATQVAFASDGDFVATEGLVAGLTLPHARFAPFVELGAHGGLGRRSVWIPIDDHPSDYGTFFFLLTGDVGVDAHLGPKSALSVALGVQRSTFYLSLGDPMDPVVLVHDTTATFKVGVGF